MAVNPVALLFTACPQRLSSDNHPHHPPAHKVTHIGTIWPPATAAAMSALSQFDGVGTWIGLLLGTLVKLVISLAMVGLFGFAMLFG